MIVKKQIIYLMMFLCIVPVISLLFLVTTVAADESEELAKKLANPMEQNGD